jgi:YD repeat-containing protein
MKNILGTTENLQLFDKERRIVYNFRKDSDGYSSESTYDLHGNVLTYKDSNGYSHEITRDSEGKILTYKDSNGKLFEFDIPEYTMEELVEKLGNFKIKKYKSYDK